MNNILMWFGIFKSKFLLVLSFSLYLFRRTRHDRLSVSAGYLTYVTLLSLVPLLAVMFAMLSAFPVFSDLRLMIEDFIFSNFVPAAGDVIRTHMVEFIGNVNRMTAIGMGALVVVALLLISAVDQTLNFIWRNRTSRRWPVALSVYWMILTLGPLLVGGSLALSSYLLSLQFFSGPDASILMTWTLKLLPYLFSVAAFLMLYLLVPNLKVKVSHALIGSIIAAVLFELSKKAFVLYISGFQSYQAIYGALATIPILFVWIYLCWLVILLGAECTAALGEYNWLSPSKNKDYRQIHEIDAQALLKIRDDIEK